MGFIDYVVEYFKGPQGDPGADGAPGATGPAGPGTVHRLPGVTLEEGGGSGTYSATITLPAGALLISASPVEMNPTGAATGITSWAVTQPFEDKVKVEAVLDSPVTSIINVAVLYYLP